MGKRIALVAVPDAPAVQPARPAAVRFDLLDLPVVGRFLRWRHARTAMQSVLLGLSLLVLYDGFLGPQLAPKNLAGVLPWLQWRGILVLVLLVAGNLFCMGCPFMLPRRLGKRLLPGNRPWPRWLPGKWVAIGLLVLFFWAYEQFSLWSSPWLTAWVALAYFVGAFVVDSVFTGAAFCKHVCPIGQFNFVNSLASPTEIAVRDPGTCVSCTTKDCISGRHDASGRLTQSGCELWLFQQRKVGNMDCTFCLDCIHACPHDNVGVLVRRPLAELSRDPQRSGIGRFGQRTDLAALVLTLVFAAFMNAFGMIGPTFSLEDWIARQLGLTSSYPVVLIVFVVGLILLPLLLIGGVGTVSRWLSHDRDGVGAVVTRFSYALAPVGFGMWLAHYGFHFMTGALTIVPVAQSFLADLGFGLLGAPRWDLAQLVPAAWISPIEAAFLTAGLLGAWWAGWHIALDRYRARRRARLAFLPWAVLCLLLFAVGLWIMSQPMQMRGTIFATGS